MSISSAHTWYLSGPMTGYDESNHPAFAEAARKLRDNEFTIISPAELNPLNQYGVSADTWGALLAVDVRAVADQVTGIIFLDGWEKSRGARLEAFTGILCNHHFARYLSGGYIEGMTAQMVLTKITRQTHEELRNAQD